jgi:hypothetical protein
VFEDPADCARLALGQTLVLADAREQAGRDFLTIQNADAGFSFRVRTGFSEMETAVIRAGGKINRIRETAEAADGWPADSQAADGRPANGQPAEKRPAEGQAAEGTR